MQLTPYIKTFIQAHLNDDPLELLLKKNKFPEIPMDFVIAQINGRKKAAKKLPNWAKNEEIIYPVKLSMEQSSSERTATYKAELVKGKTLLDMTGGFGVDTAYLSKKFDKTIYIEQNHSLFEVVKNNYETLGLSTKINSINKNSVEFLKSFEGSFDVIYLDPARRDENRQKVFLLEDCEPNLLEIKELLIEKGKEILVKLSPMLDLKRITQALFPFEIHIIAVDNECKEILCRINREKVTNPKLIASNLHKDLSADCFEGMLLEERDSHPIFSSPLKFIYEPNTSILKAGLFNKLAKEFNINKLHPHSHLYTSSHLINGFPGRIFSFEKTISLNKKVISKEIPHKKANITVRNYPMSVHQIRNKTGLAEGGDIYLFATTTSKNEKVILKCKKV